LFRSFRDARFVTGWAAVLFSECFLGLWAFWGAIENFHEGWYYHSFWMNVGMMFAQYLSPTILFLTAALVAVRWPAIGAALHIAIALAATYFLRGGGAVLPLITLPLAVLALLYYFGRPEPRIWAYRILVGFPLLLIVVCGAEPAWRVAHRIDDGDMSTRVIDGNGVRLRWAPAGPGWATDGVTWQQANLRCACLTADGLGIAAVPQNIWRLPTIDEAVRSSVRHGKNAGGTWDANTRKPTYATMPDKESPLWNTHSKVIYWWTATSVDENKAYRIVYNGGVQPVLKRARWGYLGFRCVSE
jgi:hypothetical protein